MFAVSPSDRFVVFRFGQRNGALPVGAVREIVFLPELCNPSAAPPFLTGLLNREGRLVPVLNLAMLMRLPGDAVRLHTHVIVLRAPELPLALLVDTVLAIAPAETESRTDVPGNSSFADCAIASFHWREEPVIVLAAERLLLEQERRRIDCLREIEEQRLTAVGEGAA